MITWVQCWFKVGPMSATLAQFMPQLFNSPVYEFVMRAVGTCDNVDLVIFARF